MLKQKNALISLAVSLLVASCGGGGSDGGPAPLSPAGSNTNGSTSTASGKVVDGYIAGAAVFCDANNNGVRDAGEETVLTDAQGSFTFVTACSSTIVASGGTDASTGLPFRGVLKAPPDSTVVTAGTSLLVNTSLARDRLAAALGLPGSTDLTALDPAAIGTGGALANAPVLQRTLAIQQVVQQIADAIAALLPNHTPQQTQAIYVETTNAAGSVLQASSTSLVSSSGTVDPATVNAIAQQALVNVAASADARLADAKATFGGFSKANVAALIAPAIATQAQSLASAANSDALTRSTQSDTTVADAVRQVVALLKSAVSNNVNLSAAAASLSQMVSASGAEAKAAAALKLIGDIDVQAVASAAGGELISALLNAPSNYLDVVANVIRINNNEGFDLSDLAANKVSFTTTGPATINTISVQVDPNDMKPDTGTRTIPVSVAFQLSDTGGSGQLLQLEIDKVNLSINAQNQVSASIPSDAKLYVFGRNGAGASTTLTLTNLPGDLVTATSTAPATPTSSPTNVITINTGAALAQAVAANSAVFSGFQTIKGKLDMKLVMSNVDMRQAGKLPVPNLSVLVNGADQPAVSGPGFEGVLTVQ